MVLDNIFPWGELRGKLSLTPEEAKKVFGYSMKPGATGVYFQVRNGKQVICSLVPPSNPRTPLQMVQRYKIGLLTEIAKDTFIRGIWDNLPKPRRLTGQTYFISFNSRRSGFPPNWGDIFLSLGPLPVPRICSATNYPCAKKLIINLASADNEVGVGILEPSDYWAPGLSFSNFHHFKPTHYDGSIVLSTPVSFHNPIVFIYCRSFGIYSNSVSCVAKDG